MVTATRANTRVKKTSAPASAPASAPKRASSQTFARNSSKGVLLMVATRKTWRVNGLHFLGQIEHRLGVCAAEGVEAKRVGKEPNLRPLLRTVAEVTATATAGKTAATWDFSPRVAADALVPRRRLLIRPGKV